MAAYIKFIKFIFIYITAFFAVSAFTSFTAFSEPLVAVPLNISISSGNKIIVPVNITGTSNADIKGYSLRIDYNESLLSNPVSIKTGTLSQDIPDDKFISSPYPFDRIGKFSLGAYDVSLNQDGILVKIQFDVLPNISIDSCNIIFESPNQKTALFTGAYDIIMSRFIPMQNDINGDGITDVKDIITGLQILAGLSPANTQLLSDIDNQIGMADVLQIIRYIAEK